jgi:hypothetical protein
MRFGIDAKLIVDEVGTLRQVTGHFDVSGILETSKHRLTEEWVLP